MTQRLPVTLMTGFDTQSKLAIAQKILDHNPQQKIALIVNERHTDSCIPSGIKESLEKSAAHYRDVRGGCIGVNKQEEFVQHLASLCSVQGECDMVLVVASQVTEPFRVADTIHYVDDEDGATLSHIAYIDSIVNVVDMENFLSDYIEAQTLAEKGLNLDEEDERNQAQLLADQIEFCNKIVIGRAEAYEEYDREELKDILKALNPCADVMYSDDKEMPKKLPVKADLFDYEAELRRFGWADSFAIYTEKSKEIKELATHCHVFHSRKPFHPERLEALLESDWVDGYLLRSKGFFWLATRNEMVGMWSQAGGILSFQAGGDFLAATPRDEWPQDEAMLQEIKKNWVEPHGDRRQELVFIGQNIDFSQLHSRLEACLLTEEELEQGMESWLEFEDNFPSWTE